MPAVITSEKWQEMEGKKRREEKNRVGKRGEEKDEEGEEKHQKSKKNCL